MLVFSLILGVNHKFRRVEGGRGRGKSDVDEVVLYDDEWGIEWKRGKTTRWRSQRKYSTAKGLTTRNQKRAEEQEREET
jgi:hypothetical protein